MIEDTNALIDSVMEVLKTMASIQVKEIEKLDSQIIFKNQHISSMIGLAGNGNTGLITIHCDNDCASKITGMMLGTNDQPDNESIVDAMGEIANMIGGNFKNKIQNDNAEELKLSLPSVVSGRDFKTHASGKNVTYKVGVEDGDMFIELSLKE